MAKPSETDVSRTSVHGLLMGDSNAQKRSDNEWAVVGAAFRALPGHVVHVARSECVEPDVEGVVDVLWSTKGLDPEIAWGIAVSGNTAARVAGTCDEELYAGVSKLLTRAAAYGWWPKRNFDGRIVAVPLDQWVAEGHSFTRQVSDLETMLDRWGIPQVVIDASADGGAATDTTVDCPPE